MAPPRLAVALALVLVLGALLAAPLAAEPVYPALAGRVVDEAGLLSSAQRAAISAKLAGIEETSGAQVVVVTLGSLQGYAIEELGYKLGRHWGIGRKDADDGVLLIVAPNDRKTRIEVGRGLEPTLTDALTKAIIERTILPRFRRGDFAGGIEAGVDEIAQVLGGNAAEVGQRLVEKPSELDWVAVVFLLIWLGVVLYSIWRAHRAAREQRQLGAKGKGRRSGSDSDTIVPPGGWGGSGGWSGGSGGGGSWGGGGGSFGGGGSSGSW